uniref:N-acetyl-D-glucosamine kinase n=1 Tax=Panagrolaimus sp. ES5 TaxID=591445 RepID=A0AC34G5I7_9BILA
MCFSRWSIGIELKQLNLKCERLQISIEEEHEISIGKITSTSIGTMASGDHQSVGERRKIYAGVEGGATHFNFIFIDANGNKLGEGTGLGLNILLEGIEQASDKIASALRQCATSSSIPLPIDSLGLGLSGAEDEEVNNSMIEYFKTEHSDICSTIHLTTDAVISIAATFSKGGVVIIAGTGSTCRLLKEDGDVYGCGGWGHLITDYASGFWISQQAVRILFDVEDGYTKMEETVENLKKIILNHFKIESKLSLLNIFYGPKFEKAKIASLCEALALEGSNDPIISGIFHEAGCHLAKMLIAVSKNFDQEMYDTVPLLAIGSVWKSWNLLKPGFMKILKEESIIRRVSIYQLEESPRIGAAVLAAKIKLGENFDSKDTRGKTRLIDEIRNIH